MLPPTSRSPSLLRLLLLLLLFVAWDASEWRFGGAAAQSSIQRYPSLSEVTCNVTFNTVRQRFSRYWLGPAMHGPGAILYMLSILPIAVNCPADCTSDRRAGVVRGSFPYLSTSPVCMAAIHAGIINATEGGGVLVSQFFRHDWSNTPTQSTFPFGSNKSSLSNGVQSEDVPWVGTIVPSPSTAFSFTVRGRGDRVVQRRQAPFPPRSNHLHIYGWMITGGGNNIWEWHIIAGGRNSTHFLNDVWLGWTAASYSLWSDYTWHRLSDARWSPRSDMLARGCGGLGRVVFINSESTVPNMCYVLGGQTVSQCGLYELGQCSDEVWRLHFRFNMTVPNSLNWWLSPPFSVEWGDEPIFRLPSPTRCGAQFAWHSQRDDNEFDDAFDRLLIHGGQLSYRDPTCSSQPRYTNDVWTTLYYYNETGVNWTLSEPAPYSPRRLTALADGGDAIGGVRYRITSNGTGVARLVAADVMADVWLCARYIPYSDQEHIKCAFSHDDDEEVYLPSTFLAVPGGGAVRLREPSRRWEDQFNSEVSFGGFTSAEYVRQWSLAQADVDNSEADWSQILYNATMLVGPIDYYNDHSWQKMMAGRGWLPANATLDEAELNDAEGMYHLGSDYIQTYVRPTDISHAAMPPYSTLHHQPYAFANDPADATVWVPQAAPSSNTTRPLFNFRLRRVDHQYFPQWDSFSEYVGRTETLYVAQRGVVSGGRSGDVYSSDWINMQQPVCFHPRDPSYRELLGPVGEVWPVQTRLPLDGSESSVHFASWDGWSFPAGELVHAACLDGYHFEPPLLEAHATLVCTANTVWMDPTVRSIRRCVADRLNCTYPLKDLGDVNYCEPTPPIVNRLLASFHLRGNLYSLSGPHSVTLHGVPLIEAVQLTIIGNAFFKPVKVLLGGKEMCMDGSVELLAADGATDGWLPSACFNTTVPNGNSSVQKEICVEYGRAITCLLPMLDVQSIVVTVQSGLAGEVTVAEGDDGADVATLSIMAPLIVNLTANASDCVNVPQALGQFALGSCPIMHNFNVRVCVSPESVGGTADGLSAWLTEIAELECVGHADLDSDEEVCLRCTVFPFWRSVQLTVRRNSQQIVLQSHPVTLSFSQCLQGTRFDLQAAFSLNHSASLCVSCEPGTSTDGAIGALTCSACPLGHYSNATGSAVCTECKNGTYAATVNSTQCLQCPANSYARGTGTTQCEPCRLDTFIVYKNASMVGVEGECEPCPDGAWCNLNGTITTRAGTYLVIDQTAGTLQGIACSPLACVQAIPWWVTSANGSAVSNITAGQPSPQYIAISNLMVLNQCAEGRWPAYVADRSVRESVHELYISEGHNVLCAACLPDHSRINGRCVPCTSTHVVLLCGMLVLTLLLVYLVHRLPHDVTGSATLSIVSNFVQLSALFVASSSVPQLLSLFNMQLLADRTSNAHDSGDGGGTLSSCIVPLSDAQRMLLSFLSPLMALALLSVLLSVQLLWRYVLLRGSRQRHDQHEHRQSELLLPQAPVGRVLTVYRVVWIPGSASLWKPPVGPRDGVEVGADMHCVAADSLLAASHLRWPYQRTVVRLMLLSYTGLSMASLDCFNWQDVGDFGRRLVDYPTMRPDSPAYTALLPIAVLVLVTAVVAMPVAMAAMLGWYHRTGVLETAKGKQASGVTLSAESQQKLNWKEALLLQLTAMYRAECWWMAPFVLLRRLLVVALLVGIRSSVVWGWLTMVLCSLLALHQQLQPYVRVRDNALETMCLFSLVLQAGLRTMYSPTYPSPALLGSFNALVVAPLVPALLILLHHWWMRWKTTPAI